MEPDGGPASVLGTERSAPESFILKMKAAISGTPLADEELPAQDISLGCLEFYLIRVGEAMNEGARMADVFDSYQETMDAACAIFDGSLEEFRPAVQKKFADAVPFDDILLLHRLTIHPLARGQRLGLSVLKQAIHDWSSGCSLVVMKPFPLQFEGGAKNRPSWNELRFGDFLSDKATAHKRLTKYYERLGFQQLGRSQFYAICPRSWTPRAFDQQLRRNFTFPPALLAGSRTNHASSN